MHKKIIETLNQGGIGVLPTDTIYGISASAAQPDAIEKVYELTGRPLDKPCIILISRLEDLKSLGIFPSAAQLKVLKELWPGPNSVVFGVESKRLEHLHRGKKSLAVRLPNNPLLQRVIKETGPIISTSANHSGEPTPDNIEDIQAQLPGLDFYLAGPVSSKPSRLVFLSENGETEFIDRQR